MCVILIWYFTIPSQQITCFQVFYRFCINHCRGTRLSDFNARRCLDFLKPKSNEVEEDSWEELDSKEITTGAWALPWLIWVNHFYFYLSNI